MSNCILAFICHDFILKNTFKVEEQVLNNEQKVQGSDTTMFNSSTKAKDIKLRNERKKLYKDRDCRASGLR